MQMNKEVDLSMFGDSKSQFLSKPMHKHNKAHKHDRFFLGVVPCRGGVFFVTIQASFTGKGRV